MDPHAGAQGGGQRVEVRRQRSGARLFITTDGVLRRSGVGALWTSVQQRQTKTDGGGARDDGLQQTPTLSSHHSLGVFSSPVPECFLFFSFGWGPFRSSAV